MVEVIRVVQLVYRSEANLGVKGSKSNKRTLASV